MKSLFQALLIYYPRITYNNNYDMRSKSKIVDENIAALHNLMKELKVKLTESQELQVVYHKKHVKEGTYLPGDSVWLIGKYLKTKRNPKLEDKYLGHFGILEGVGKQSYKLK